MKYTFPLKSIFLLSFLFLLLSSVFPVYAHKVNLFAYAEGNKVVVEGFFSDGKVAKKAQIQVFSPSGDRLVQDQADDDGVFVFEIPEVTDLRVSLYAGMGHRAEFTLPADEIRGALAAAASGGAAAAGGESSAPARSAGCWRNGRGPTASSSAASPSRSG